MKTTIQFLNATMSRDILLIACCLLPAACSFAQAPQTIPYQAVARDTSGNLIASQAISLRFSIHDVTAGGTVVYRETQSATTNLLGLFTVNIGQGTAVTGIFSSINWGGGSKFIQVELDATGGVTYVDMGTQQMLSVPYALYAGSSSSGWNLTGNAGTNPSTNFIGTTDAQPLVLKVNNNKAGYIDYEQIGGNENTGFGYQTLNSTTEFENSAFGFQALFSNTTGKLNTAMGRFALYSNDIGNQNTANGVNALVHNTTGGGNTASGQNALLSNTTGTFITAVGFNADVLSNNLYNATAIGANAKVSTDFSLVLGDGSVNVGIGTTAPLEKLHVVGNIRSSPLGGPGTRMVQADVNGTLLPLPAGTATQVLLGTGVWGSVPGWGLTGNFGTNAATNFIGTTDGVDLVLKTTNTERMRVQALGNVGIGTNSPAARLHVSAGDASLALFGPNGWGGQLYVGAAPNQGVGLTAQVLASDGNLHIDPAAGHNIYIGYYQARNIYLNPFGGNVGIGTTNPTRATVEIVGSQTTFLSYGYLTAGGATGASSGTNIYSLYASARIAASEFNAYSDARIKKVIGLSNNEQDLSTLMGIRITDYTYVDNISKDALVHKKVIAQELEKVFPNAVSKITDEVPDIFMVAEIKDGKITVPNNLKAGEKIKLIFKDRTQLLEVVEADANSFRVNATDQGKVFVYGRQVNDFRVVDYEALTTLGISAIQELNKKILALEKELSVVLLANADIEKLKAENAAMKSDIEKIMNPQQ